MGRSARPGLSHIAFGARSSAERHHARVDGAQHRAAVQQLRPDLRQHAADLRRGGLVPQPHRRTSRRSSSFLRDARTFARGRYAAALQQGNSLSAEERQAIAAEAARFTGLTPAYILANNLRVDPSRFRKELLRDQGRIIGRLDARFTGSDPDRAGEAAAYDPQDRAISGAWTAMINDYLFRDLGYRTPLTYRPSNDVFKRLGLEARRRRRERQPARRGHQRRSRRRHAREPESQALVGEWPVRPRHAVRRCRI